MAMEKRADPENQLEVDEAILDYLLYTAIRALLDDRRNPVGSGTGSEKTPRADSHLQMVAAFLVLFRANHPEHPYPVTIQFRMRLLKYTAMFTRRFMPSETNPTLPALNELRGQNRDRAQTYLAHRGRIENKSLRLFGSDSDSPPPGLYLHTNRQRVLAGLSMSIPFPEHYGLSSSLSLLDTLPAFMALSAAQKALQDMSELTLLWMRLAAQYMAQAIIEQYLVYGVNGPEALQEAFAWGFDGLSEADEGSDDFQINAMFLGEEDEVPEWSQVRDEHIQALLPPDGVSLQHHLESLAANSLSSRIFEDGVLRFLSDLLKDQPEPMLVQLENGMLEGLSRKETQAMKERAGFT